MGFNNANNTDTDNANTDAKQRETLDIRDNLCYNVFVGGRSA